MDPPPLALPFSFTAEPRRPWIWLTAMDLSSPWLDPPIPEVWALFPDADELHRPPQLTLIGARDPGEAVWLQFAMQCGSPAMGMQSDA